jgi:hypothetical protein
MNSEAPGLQQHGKSRVRTDTGFHADDNDSEDDMDGFFDSEEHSPNAENGSNDCGTENGVPTWTNSNEDDVNGINFPFVFSFCL